jgi:hypothetical protein
MANNGTSIDIRDEEVKKVFFNDDLCISKGRDGKWLIVKDTTTGTYVPIPVGDLQNFKNALDKAIEIYVDNKDK